MKPNPLLALICLSSMPLLAAEPQDSELQGGFSYFTTGFEHVSYQEEIPGMSSSVAVLSPVINTGALYDLNEKWGFSLDAFSTFSSSNCLETWKNKNGLSQTNQFQYNKTATNVLLHYKITPAWRIVMGPSFTYQTYKRFQRKSFQPNNPTFVGTWEENSSDIFLDAGIAYNSDSLYSDERWHSYFKATAGLPLWSATRNTAIDNVTFNDFSIRATAEGGIAYQLVKGVNLGWYLQLGFEKRFQEGPQFWRIDDNTGKPLYVTLPAAETLSISSGLQLLWQLG